MTNEQIKEFIEKAEELKSMAETAKHFNFAAQQLANLHRSIDAKHVHPNSLSISISYRESCGLEVDKPLKIDLGTHGAAIITSLATTLGMRAASDRKLLTEFQLRDLKNG